MLRVYGVVAAYASVFQHLVVVGEAGRRCGGTATSRKRRAVGGAQVDHGTAQGAGQRPDAGTSKPYMILSVFFQQDIRCSK